MLGYFQLLLNNHGYLSPDLQLFLVSVYYVALVVGIVATEWLIIVFRLIAEV